MLFASVAGGHTTFKGVYLKNHSLLRETVLWGTVRLPGMCVCVYTHVCECAYVSVCMCVSRQCGCGSDCFSHNLGKIRTC